MTNSTDILASSGLTPSNQVRKNLKNPKQGKYETSGRTTEILLPKTDSHAINVTCTEHNNMITTVHLEYLSSYESRNPDIIWIFYVGPEVIVIMGWAGRASLGSKSQDLLS